MRRSTDTSTLGSIKVGSGGFPDDNIPDEQKNTKEFNLAWAKAIYANWLIAPWGGKASFTENLNSNRVSWDALSGLFDEYRDYMMGMQSTWRYDRLFTTPKGKDGTTGDGQTNTVIDKRVNAVAAKYMRLVHSIICEVPPVLEVMPGDTASTSQMQEAKYRDVGKVMQKAFIDSIYKQLGVESMQQDDAPQTTDEIELYDLQGGYRPAFATAMQSALYASMMSANKFEDLVKELVFKDMIPVGIGAFSTHLDSGGVIRVETVPPELLLLPMCNRNDFSDAKYQGARHVMDLPSIKQMAGDQFTEDEYRQIESRPTTIFTANTTSGGISSGDVKKYEVLEFYYYTSNKENHRIKEYSSGNKSIERKASDWEPKGDNETVTALRTSYKCVYQGWWIVGTDFVYNYGKMPNQAMRGLGDARLPIKVVAPYNFKMRWKSIVEEIMPDIDMVQVATRKWIQIVSRIQPDGLAILDDWLKGTPGADGVAMDKATLIKAFMASGILSLVNPNPEYDSYGGQGIPLTPIQMSQREPMQAATEALLMAIANIERKIGVNDATNAGTANSDALVGIQQMQAQGTVNALRPYIDAVDKLIEQAADIHATLIIQAARGEGDDTYWRSMIGDTQWETIKQLAFDSTLASVNIRVLKRISADDRAFLEQSMLVQQDIRAKTGTGGLDYESVLLIREQAKTNLRKALWLLAVQKRKLAREDAKREEAASKMRMEEAQAQNAASMEAVMAQITAKSEADTNKNITVMQSKSAAVSQELAEKAQITQQEMILQSNLDTQKLLKEFMLKMEESQRDREFEKQLVGVESEAAKEEIRLAAEVAPKPVAPSKK